MMVGEAVVDEVLVGGQVGFTSRLGDISSDSSEASYASMRPLHQNFHHSHH